MSAKIEYFQPVRVKLSSDPEIRTTVDGSEVIVRLNQCNNKLYSYLVDPDLDIHVGDLVVCQARSSFTFGIVYDASDTLVSHEAYLENVLLEEGAHKLVVSKVDFSCVTSAIRAKRLYEAEKRKIDTRTRLNQEAWNNVKEQLYSSCEEQRADE